MLDRLLAFLRRDVERARAGHAHWLEGLRALELEELGRFCAALRLETPGPDDLILARGETPDATPGWFGFSYEELLHGVISGSSGSGKSMMALILCARLLPHVLANRCALIVLDHKGELSDLAGEALAAFVTTPGGEQLLDHVRTVRPFKDPDLVPLLRLTAREPHTPIEIQALGTATAIAETLGDELSLRQVRCLARSFELAIELDARGDSPTPLPAVRDWLDDPLRLAAAAQRSANPELKQYLATLATNESRATLAALSARLDLFLHQRATRLALSAPSCLSWEDALGGGLTRLDLGDAPGGAEVAMRSWSALLIGALIRAVLSRRDSSIPVLLICDEIQEGLAGPAQRALFSRAISLARFRKVVFLLLFQDPGQLDSTLLRILLTNAGWSATFRLNPQDAAAVAPLLPVPKEAERPSEVRRQLVQQLSSLPRRSYLLWPKWRGLAPQVVRSPKLDLADLRRRAATAAPEVHERIRRGSVTVLRAELEESLARERAVAPRRSPPDKPAPAVPAPPAGPFLKLG